MYVKEDLRTPAVFGLIAALAGAVVSTGIFSIVLITAASLAGTNFSEFYRALPTPGFGRDRSELATIVLGHALFLAYVITTIVLTLMIRRRLAEKWRERVKEALVG